MVEVEVNCLIWCDVGGVGWLVFFFLDDVIVGVFCGDVDLCGGGFGVFVYYLVFYGYVGVLGDFEILDGEIGGGVGGMGSQWGQYQYGGGEQGFYGWGFFGWIGSVVLGIDLFWNFFRVVLWFMCDVVYIFLVVLVYCVFVYVFQELQFGKQFWVD